MLLGYASCHGESKRKRKHDKAHDNVRRMKTNQRVIGRSEEIGLYRQTLIVDEVIPLPRRRDEKDGSEQNGACQTGSCSYGDYVCAER